MKFRTITIGVILISLALALLCFAAYGGWKAIPLNYENPFQRILATLASLFVVATLLERSLAVFNRLILGAESVSARNSLRNALTLAKASALYYEASDRFYVHDVQKARLFLDVINDKKKWLRLCIGFFVATLMAMAGFQILANFVESAPSGNQLKLFTGVDIFLTAGLLAGGSQGIAELIETFKRFLDDTESTKNAEALVVKMQNNAQNLDLNSAGVLSRDLKTYATENGINVFERRRQSHKPDLTWLGGISHVKEYNHEHHDSSAHLEICSLSDQKAGLSFNIHADSWRLAKSLVKLRSEINEKYPNRSKLSDGSIGDSSHCPGSSDHCPNEDSVVTAFDCTHDPKNDCDMGIITEKFRVERDSRIKYVIYNKRMYSSYEQDGVAPWTWRPYNKTNPHIKHAHFSVKGDPTAYDNESSWPL